jgi:signal transduction histidine kinase
MPSVDAGAPLAAARRRRGVPLADAIRTACGLYFADEALSSVRHDILNRVTAMGAITFELRGLAPAPGEVRDRLEDLNRQIGLICGSVARRLAGPRSDPAPRCPLREVVDAVAGASPIRLEIKGPPATPRLWAAIEPVALGVVLTCLVDNAREAGSSRVRISWSAAEEARIALQVSDDGSGLAPAAEAQAFERFFTTKPGHAGLGLCVARTILVRWLGDLQIERGGREGTRATLLLPAAPRRGKSEPG